MIQKVREVALSDLGGGLVTLSNFFSLRPNQTPNCMNVKFGLGGTIEKRFGSTTMNATALVPVSATGFSPDTNKTLSTNLQAFWNMNELVGPRLDQFLTNDLTPNGTTLPGSAAGRIGNAVLLSAASVQYLALSDNAAISMGNINFSISAWVYIDSKGADNMCIIGKGDANNTNNLEYYLNWTQSGDLFRFIVGNSSLFGSLNATSFGSPATATWIFIAAWHDSANGLINIQVNNLGINSASYVGGGFDNAYPLNIGHNPQGTGGDPIAYFNGRIDSVGIWKKTLTAQERTDLYNSGTGNEYNKAASSSGWGMADFGAGVGVDGKPLRWLVIAAGTGIYASSNRGQTFVVIATDRGAGYQYFERSKSLLIATSDTGNKVLYWAGSVGTFMQALAPGSAPPARFALDFAGFLLLMSDSAGLRTITYADNTKITTDPWTSTFSLPSSFDDEVTGGVLLYKSAYAFTRYKTFRISAVGGNPDFSVYEVKNWGAVPRTVKRVTFPEIGEVILCLGYDKKVRQFDGSEDRIISDVVEQSNGLSDVYLNAINVPFINKCHSEFDTLEQVYKLWLVISPSIETTHMLGLNIRTGAWYPYDNQGFKSVVMAESANWRHLFGVKIDGYVEWIDTTNLDRTTAINEFYQSPFFFGRTPKQVEKTQNISLYFSATSSGSINYQDRTDFNAPFSKPRDSILFVNTGGKIQIIKTIDIPLTQNIYQWQISDSASAAVPWKLNRQDLRLTDLGVGEA